MQYLAKWNGMDSILLSHSMCLCLNYIQGKGKASREGGRWAKRAAPLNLQSVLNALHCPVQPFPPLVDFVHSRGLGGCENSSDCQQKDKVTTTTKFRKLKSRVLSSKTSLPACPPACLMAPSIDDEAPSSRFSSHFITVCRSA